MLRPLEEFLWMLRRHGFSLGPAQAIDAARAVALTGWEEMATVREALALVILQKRSDRPRFETIFNSFFCVDPTYSRDLFCRLEAQGLTPQNVDDIRALLEALREEPGASGDAVRALLGWMRGAALDGALATGSTHRALVGLTSRRQVGYFTQQIIKNLKFHTALSGLTLLRSLLVAELGEEVGQKTVSLLQRELELARSEVRFALEQEVLAREETAARNRSFERLTTGEIEGIRKAVRALGEKLRGAARVRERRWSRGKIDTRSMIHASMRWSGVPIRLLFRKKIRQKPRLWVLCDVSESVRSTAVFLLEFAAVTQDLFDRTRTFAFVSSIVETTSLFASASIEQALAKVLGGEVVNLAGNSNYGHALRSFEERFGREIDRRSTLVIVGDGRSNYQDPSIKAVERLRERARSILWLCPEPRAQWGSGDSMMPHYARVVTEVLSATTAQELEEAARALLHRR